jgi:hypothetical protein
MEVRVVDSGANALEAIPTFQPHVVFVGSCA